MNHNRDPNICSSAHKFLDLGCLADSVSEIIQLCTSDLTASDDFDLGHERAVKRPGLLNAHTVAGLPYSKGLPVASALSLKYGTLEDLDPFPVSFLSFR